MKKKLLLIMLSSAMVLAMSACGSDATTKESEVSKSSESTSEAQEDVSSETEEDDSLYPIVEEPITVKGVVVGRPTDVRTDRLVWNKVSEITGINIEWECVDWEAFPTYLAGGDWPDFIHQNLSQSQINDYGVLGGRFVNFYDYLDLMPNLVKTFEDYPIVKKGATHSNGEMYGLPGVEVSATLTAARPYVRTDVLEAAGLEMPKTIEEFYNALVVLKEKNGTAGWIPNLANDESYWAPMVYAAFGTLTNMNFDDDGTGKVIFNRTSEQMRLYYEFMNKLYEEELIHEEFLTMESAARLEYAKALKAPFLETEASDLAQEDFADGEFHIDCCAPLTSEYDSTQEILGKSPYFNACNIFINKECEYIEELCQMFDIMYATEEVVEGSGLHGMSFCYGLEGVDWDYGPEGSGTYTFHIPEGYTSFSDYQAKEVRWGNVGRLDALAGLVTDTVSNNRARQVAFVENVIPYQSDLYFPVNLLNFTDDEQYILDNRLADIKSYYKEMEGKFITGVVDIETGWDEYCETLEKMGVQEVIEVYQAAYDRFNAE